jgi:hypothetical protein
MAMFPILTTGAVTQYPSGRRTSYSTCVTQFVDGSEQRFREFRRPVRHWIIRLSHVSASEAAAVDSFFLSMQGRFGSFSFVDPWDGQEYTDCSFDQATLAAAASTDSNYQSQLVIRNNTL